MSLIYSSALTILAPILLHMFFTTNHKKNLLRVVNSFINLGKKPRKIKLMGSKQMNLPNKDIDTNSLFINLAWVVSLGFISSLLHIKYSTFFLLPLGLLIVNFLVNAREQNYWLESLFHRKTWAALVGALFAYGPQLINSFQNGQLLGMASQRNNDVVYYALTTKAYLDNGFINNNQLLNQNVNEAALKYQHQGANQLTSFISEFVNLPPYMCMNIVALFIILETILILTKIVKVLYAQVNFPMTLAIATGVVTTPILNYIYSNYFLGQMTGIFITACLTLLLCRFTKKQIGGKEVFIQTLTLTVLSIYFYPTSLVIFLGFTLLYIQIVSIGFRSNQQIKKPAKALDGTSVYGFVLGLLISAPYLVFATNFVLILSNGSYGWSIRPLDPSSIFISAKYIDLQIPSFSLRVVSWFILIVAILFFAGSSSIPKSIKVSVIPIILFVATYVYAFGGGEWGQYKNWKLVSFFMPYLLVIFYVGLVSHKQFGRRILFVLLLISFTSPYASWLPILQGKVPANVLTGDQVNVGKDDNLFLKQYESLSVNMPTWFETMAMANILDNNHIALISPSYLPVVPVNPGMCILQPVEPLNSNVKDFSSNYQVKSIDGSSC